MNKVIDMCWEHYLKFNNNSDLNFVVNPSIPILYFGDHDAYRKSELRIVTVALNPSKMEFPNNNGEPSFTRFKIGNLINDLQSLGVEEKRIYQSTLNIYYEDDPYWQWFTCFEPILNGMDASFYIERNGVYPYRAIHTDICTPLATDPVWNGLQKAYKNELLQQGRDIWKALIQDLKPHVILISVAENHLTRQSCFTPEDPNYHVYTNKTNGEPFARPYTIKTYRLSFSTETIVYWGPAAVKPFQFLASDLKIDLGKRILSSAREGGFLKDS